MLGLMYCSKMAATSAGRVLSLCRQFQKSFSISTALLLQQTNVLTSCKAQLSTFRPKFCLLHINNLETSLAQQCRALHTSQWRRGLEEFFDETPNWGEPTVKSGAPWTAKQLRTKSSEDLHKLWYVLLKEKNMLLTVEQEAKRQRVQMPSPERLKKIERSMKRLDTIVQERENALRLLQTGQERARPGTWRKDFFGRTFWYRFKEYPIPWYLNRRYKRKRFFTPKFVDSFIRLRIESHLHSKILKKKADLENKRKLQEKFSKHSART
ncbi:39S ribosomal protein L47, mitochondrial-like [Acipenser oxyrinchus oxyrinchus]|uniref:Large ribosomal subunit protein uL29m n=1 Tax=Acipenser oxyrinchus oxyrinchus TaxID=40147 RepID=A0AAD8FZ46_ACIOX|nr:39S ribosomal protein L47, mitochondrial-like [Acipenser oxyrinchus oxyrinchus]